ncbi:MAG: DegT/DnrJ/EryC1/StrS family aminotransferase [Clostridia bacterium]|nr:DegT/DnrJ/EryC1/StrS family aminotransferase [Clostridia bacterium]
MTKNTKAIIPVHIQGFPCKMDAICELAKKYNIAVVEDACQSTGGKFGDKDLGTIGDAGAYSYNYFKVLSAGEGGALVTENRKIYERALIYHDSSAVAFFGTQLDGIKEPLFGGTEFRISDITGAILREQLKKLPLIIEDLHKNKFAVIEKLNDKLTVAPSHDAQGDCATTLAFRFETEEETRSFAANCKEKGLEVTIPADTGKHVYTNWTQIMEKRGALHPAMDPFRMKENQGLQMDYTMDMCPKTLDYLARTAYIWVSPDWTEENRNDIAEIINNAV